MQNRDRLRDKSNIDKWQRAILGWRRNFFTNSNEIISVNTVIEREIDKILTEIENKTDLDNPVPSTIYSHYFYETNYRYEDNSFVYNIRIAWLPVEITKTEKNVPLFFDVDVIDRKDKFKWKHHDFFTRLIGKDINGKKCPICPEHNCTVVFRYDIGLLKRILNKNKKPYLLAKCKNNNCNRKAFEKTIVEEMKTAYPKLKETYT